MSALLCCAKIATEKTITGMPQTRQNVVLAKSLFKRSGVVPPPGNVRLAMVTLTQTAIAVRVSAPNTSRQKVGLCKITPIAGNQCCELTLGTLVSFRCSSSHLGKSQSRNQFWLVRERSLPGKYHGELRS